MTIYGCCSHVRMYALASSLLAASSPASALFFTQCSLQCRSSLSLLLMSRNMGQLGATSPNPHLAPTSVQLGSSMAQPVGASSPRVDVHMAPKQIFKTHTFTGISNFPRVSLLPDLVRGCRHSVPSCGILVPWRPRASHGVHLPNFSPAWPIGTILGSSCVQDSAHRASLGTEFGGRCPYPGSSYAC